MGRVNENIWGAESDWITAPTTYFAPLGKVANFGDNKYTLIEGINKNKLTFDVPISDMSLSWCGMGTESNYAHCKVFNNNGDELTFEQTDIVNFFMYCIDGQQVVTEQSCSWGSDYKAYLWNGYDPGQTFGNFNANKFIAPFTDFNIKKIVWRVLVECFSSVTSNTAQTFDFNEYKNNQMTSYPVITKIYATPYVERSDSPISRTQISFLSGSHYCLAPAIFNRFNVYSNDPTAVYADYAIFNGDRQTKILLFGSDVQNSTPSYLVSVGNCKRKTTSPRKTYQDENLNDVLESALKTIACFGFYFVLDGETHINDSLDSDYIYMGVIPEGGVTHGEYTHGAANRDNPNWNLTNTKTSDYDYQRPVDYSNTSDLTSYYLSTGFTRLYAVDITDMDSLSTAFSTAVQNLSTDVNDVEKAFFTNNPLDCVVSLKYFPFKLSKIATFANTTIKLGNNDTGISSEFMAGLVVPYPFGETYIPEYFGDFRDIEPYTTLDLVVPFCGSVRLSPSVFCGHTLRLKMAIDLFTGSCCCYIYRDNLIVDSISGNCSIDLPVSGVQAADLNNAVFQNVTNAHLTKTQIQQNRTTAGYNLLSGVSDLIQYATAGQKARSNSNNFRPLSVSTQSLGYDIASEIMSQMQSNYELHNIETPFNIIGSASAACSLMQEMNARLIIHRPKMDTNYINDPTSFGNVNGYATLTSGSLSSFTGLTKCTAVDLSGLTASNEEINMIRKALLQGVRIKAVTP